MAVRVGINGFGRIGRNVLRSIIEAGRTDIEVVAINDLGPVETNAHLLRYDSVHGRFPATVTTTADSIDAGRGPISVTAERDPTKLPWQDVDIALECTGIFTDGPKAALHLQNGSKRVLVSAPVSGANGARTSRSRPSSTASTTTRWTTRTTSSRTPPARPNCLAPGRLRPQRGGGDRARVHDRRSTATPATSRRSTRCTRTSTAPARRR
jgi:glyceraldehyde-3-phosphate dehydrogenase/erythrose-4-phosphate dehydrogenase